MYAKSRKSLLHAAVLALVFLLLWGGMVVDEVELGLSNIHTDG